MRINQNRELMSYLNPSSVNRTRHADGAAAEARTTGTNAAAKAADSVRLSPVARQLQRAEHMLNAETEPRPEAIARGKELLQNWRTLADEPVDTIMSRILNDET